MRSTRIACAKLDAKSYDVDAENDEEKDKAECFVVQLYHTLAEWMHKVELEVEVSFFGALSDVIWKGGQ
jgi:hypothetical protein